MKKSPFYVAGMAVLVVASLTGCGNSHTADKQQVTQNVTTYIQDYASKSFSSLMPLVSGDALTSLQDNMKSLESMNIQNTVKNIKVSNIDFPDSTHAMAEATYLLTQTIPNYGTSEDDYTVEYYLRMIAGEWKVYATQTEIDAPATGNNA